MPDDQGFNSMQAQLGLVGQGGSFNPLGIATPPPMAPPIVRHPGEISQDIVRQTQTAMATTLQTTSAMRMGGLGGMGGMAFGGGSGMGVGAIGAFSQQYQQNMAGIQSQQVAPFSAQMMGMMGGMGGGFAPGMLPNPAMMTSPGMGIYRPFPQGAAPTVSPFPQMPMIQTPFSVMPPPPMFQTPMELSNNMAIQGGQRRTAGMFATPGVIARGAADVGLGYMGAGLGASVGARFGPMGALIGGGIGAVAGAWGSEHFGLGATAQHITDRVNPFRTMAIRGQQMMSASQDWVTGGSDMNMISGRGLSSRGATHLGRMLEDTAFSTKFRRETNGAFSAQDLTRITNVSGQQGLLNDTQSVEGIHDRVKTIAKSLVSFMKIANEPNVVEALKSMGRMRTMGLSVSETMDAAVDARMYARMAGTTSKGIMESGGMPGAMLFQQQGLSAGLGMRVGMGAMGMAQAAVAGGSYTPQRLAMLGGVQGVAQHEMESSAAFLKMPMMAAAMSQMGAGGSFGVQGGALQALRGGKLDLGQMATMGANNLAAAVRKQGIGALGMMEVQGAEIQDDIGRALGPQGLQAAKMQQVMQTMKMMNLDKNPGGFATASRSMGFTVEQTRDMMSKAGSPGYWNNLQQQNSVSEMDTRAMEHGRLERERPGMFRRAWRNNSNGGDDFLAREANELYRGFRNFGEGVTNFFGGGSESDAASQGQVSVRTSRTLLADDDTLRQFKGLSREERLGLDGIGLAGPGTRGHALGDMWDTELGGDRQNLNQLRQYEGGVAGIVGGGNMERGFRFLQGNALFNSTRDNEGALKGYMAGADVLKSGTDLSESARSKMVNSLGSNTKENIGIGADVEMALTRAAKAKRNTIGGDSNFSEDELIQIAKDAAAKSGKTLTDAEAKKMVAAQRDRSDVNSGGSQALTAREGYDVKSDSAFKDRVQAEQDNVTRSLFGKEGEGWDLGRGTRDERSDLVTTMFEGNTDARAVELAALQAASGDSQAAEAKYKAKLQELGTGPDADRITAQALKVRKRVEAKDGGADLRRMGLAGAQIDNFAGALEEGHQKMIGSKVATKLRSGKINMFGSDAGNKSMKDLLESSSSEELKGPLRDIKDKYDKATTDEERAQLESEAQAITMNAGTQGSEERKGGVFTGAIKNFETVRGLLAGTENDVGSAFPQAVTTFQEASLALKDAAQKLSSGSDTTLFGNNAGGH